MKKVLIIGGAAIVFCLLVLYLVFRTSENTAVKIEFNQLQEVVQGKPFDFEVSVLSEEAKVLKNAKLVIYLPSGVFFVGEDEARRVEEKILGDVGPGSLNKETFSLIAMGETGEKKNIRAKLTYAIAPNEKVFFEIQKDFEIELGESAINLTVDTSEEVSSGEVFDIKLKYKNEGEDDLKNLSLKIDYPPIFKYKEASVEPDEGENEWRIVLLAKEEERELVVTGSVVGFTGASFELPVSIVGNFDGQEYTLRTERRSIRIAEAPLSVSFQVNGSSGLKNEDGEYVAKRGETLKYVLNYRNNSDTNLNNVQLKAKFWGEAFDFGSVKTGGSFNSFDKMVTWNLGNVSEFQNLAPGISGSVEVEIGVRGDLAVRRLADKNFVLKVEAEIRSANSPSGSVGLVSLSKLETKVAGEVGVDAKAFYRDAATGILNEGEYPPRIGVRTQFTIHWILKNYFTDLSGAEFSARLPAGVKWTGKTKTNSTNEPVYDEVNNLVRWKIDRVVATRGVLSDPYEAVFQVEVTPTAGQVGQILDLLGPTDFVAHDDFVDVTINGSDVKLDTNLPDDYTVQAAVKTVQP